MAPGKAGLSQGEDRGLKWVTTPSLGVARLGGADDLIGAGQKLPTHRLRLCFWGRHTGQEVNSRWKTWPE